MGRELKGKITPTVFNINRESKLKSFIIILNNLLKQFDLIAKSFVEYWKIKDLSLQQQGL